MAARTRRIANDDNTRAKIQTTQIVKRLTKHVLGELELTPTQVNAAKILLGKTLPDLQSVEVSAEVEHSVAAAQPMTTEEWLKESAGHLSPDPRPH